MARVPLRINLSTVVDGVQNVRTTFVFLGADISARARTAAR